MSLYKALWSRIGGRPWTFIFRDLYHNFEYFIYVGSFTIGYYLADLLSDIEYWTMVGVWTIRYSFGHFHWGKRWIENQQGK